MSEDVKEFWIDGDTLFCNTVFTDDQSETPIEQLPDDKISLTKSFYDMREIIAGNHAGKRGETTIRVKTGHSMVVRIPFGKFCEIRKEWLQQNK